MEDTFRIGIKARLKHGALWEALAKKGWTQREAARQLGVLSSTFARWINLQEVPKYLSGEQERKLFDLTGQLPDQLWPAYIRSKDFLDAPKTFDYVQDVDARKMITALMQHQLPAPDELFDKEELKEKVSEMLATLRPQEVRVITGRFFEDKTLKEVGEEMKVSRERVRIIEYQALKKLRHRSRSHVLKPFF